MLHSLANLYQTLRSGLKSLQNNSANSLMSSYLQLELPFTMASEITYLPLRTAQLARAAQIRKYLQGN